MTLTQIALLMHIYSLPEIHYQKASDVAFLSNQGLIEVLENGGYAATPKGCVYVEAIRNVPMPVQITKWVMK